MKQQDGTQHSTILAEEFFTQKWKFNKISGSNCPTKFRVRNYMLQFVTFSKNI